MLSPIYLLHRHPLYDILREIFGSCKQEVYGNRKQ